MLVVKNYRPTFPILAFVTWNLNKEFHKNNLWLNDLSTNFSMLYTRNPLLKTEA